VPQFYLHLCDGSHFAEDDEGQDLPDAKSARKAAIRGLRDVMAGQLLNGHVNLAAFIEIEDGDGKLIETIHLSDTVRFYEERGTGRSVERGPRAEED
jgi:hypothetical protein